MRQTCVARWILPCQSLVIWLFLAPASLLTAAEPPKDHDFEMPDNRPSTLTRLNIAQSGDDFRRCLEAAREVEIAKKAYANATGSLDAIYKAQQALTAAQLHYSTTSTNVRGNPALREYLTRRGEVAALQRGLAEVMKLEVTDDENAIKRQEITRYSDALKQAHQELARAEKAWKTADRAQQFRYLNRRAQYAK